MPKPSTLSDLIFSDLFVGDSPEMSWFKSTPDSLLTTPIPLVCADEIISLRQHCAEHQGGADFRVIWPDASGMRLRVKRITVADDKIIFVCRRYRVMVSSLAELGVPKTVTNRLLSHDLKNGLITFLGKPGAGKTTTAMSFVRERLILFGGVCWTVENPIELPMQGRQGKGVCYQTEVNDDHEISGVIRGLYRATPNILMIGEIRGEEAAREVIQAAASGCLVVTTFHGNDLLGSLAKFARLGGGNTAAIALADVLRVAVHLELHNAAPDTELTKTDTATENFMPKRVLAVEPLFLLGENEGERSMMRAGDFHMLTSEVERQRRSLLMGKLP